MSAGRIVLLVFGIIFLLASVFLLPAGGGLVWVNAAVTDDDGFLNSKTTDLERNSYAIITSPAQIEWDADQGMTWCCDPGDFLTLKVEGENQDSSKGIFLGIASESDVDAYLDGVRYDEITTWASSPWGSDVEYTRHNGNSEPAPPTDETFWEASAYGTGTQTLTWEPESGDWVLVIMNEDGSLGVEVSGTVGARLPWLFWLGVGMLIAGAVALAAGIVMVYFAARRPRKAVPQAAVDSPAP